MVDVGAVAHVMTAAASCLYFSMKPQLAASHEGASSCTCCGLGAATKCKLVVLHVLVGIGVRERNRATDERQIAEKDNH